MKKSISIVLAMIICLFSFSACGEEKKEPLTQNDVKTILEEYLEPQIAAYEKAYGLDDLSVDIQFKKCEITEPDEYSNGYVSYNIRDVIISPTISEKLKNGEFTDEMLTQLCCVEFDYDGLTHETYDFIGGSCFVDPVFADDEGSEYTHS